MRDILFVIICLSLSAESNSETFSTGPVFEAYGPVAAVDVTVPLPEDAAFKHSFDVATRADDGDLNRSLVSVARFINMHARAGVDVDQIQAAIVVHGGAVHDVAKGAGVNGDLVSALVAQNVRIIVCGQSATYYGVSKDDLLPGVEMALSAMTMHALLQQDGYTVNPF